MESKDGGPFMRWKRVGCVVVVVGLLATAAKSNQARKNVPQEQTNFGLEENVTRPVSIPQGVLSILVDDSEVRTSGCVASDQTADKISASWFEASQIHLDGPKEVDLLVKAKDGCLFGANIGPFWVFRKTQRAYELLLAVSALDVELLPRTTNGHKDISAGAVAGGKYVSAFYQFDGHRYVEAGSKVEE